MDGYSTLYLARCSATGDCQGERGSGQLRPCLLSHGAGRVSVAAAVGPSRVRRRDSSSSSSSGSGGSGSRSSSAFTIHDRWRGGGVDPAAAPSLFVGPHLLLATREIVCIHWFRICPSRCCLTNAHSSSVSAARSAVSVSTDASKRRSAIAAAGPSSSCPAVRWHEYELCRRSWCLGSLWRWLAVRQLPSTAWPRY